MKCILRVSVGTVEPLDYEPSPVDDDDGPTVGRVTLVIFATIIVLTIGVFALVLFLRDYARATQGM